MGEALVEVRSPDGTVTRRLPVRINGRNPTFRLATERIAANTLKPVDDVLLDLLDVAGAVFAADSTISRGTDVRSRFGERWRRDFRFNIKVRRPDVWSRQEIVDALTEAASFLTEDRFDFVFEAAPAELPAQEYLNFGEQDAAPFKIDEVILFSGGLDSLAGALESLETHRKRVALVTHRSASKVSTVQTRLGKLLRERYGGQVLHIPVQATRTRARTGKPVPARESTQRSRSLLFAALGHVIARMLGALRVSFYENGIISHNLPLNGQVVGAMATRTTHPLALHKLDLLLSLLGGERIPIANPYSWLTKTEVLQRLDKCSGAPLIRETISCTAVLHRKKNHPHCGACSQCLDRRFAVLAAGLEEYDPVDGYETDVLFGERGTDRSRTMALDWTRHAHQFAGHRMEDFMTEYAGELTRIVAGHPELPVAAASQKVHQLHTRHGIAVERVLQQQVATQSQWLVKRVFPPSSLFRMYVAQVAADPELPDVAFPRPSRSDEIAFFESPPIEPLFPLQVALSVENGRNLVRVLGLTNLSGRSADVVHALKPSYEEDRALGRTRKNARYMLTWTLADILSVKDDAVRQYVKRCRDQLNDAYVTIVREPAPEELLIQGKRVRGFRLDPDCRVIDPGES